MVWILVWVFGFVLWCGLFCFVWFCCCFLVGFFVFIFNKSNACNNVFRTATIPMALNIVPCLYALHSSPTPTAVSLFLILSQVSLRQHAQSTELKSQQETIACRHMQDYYCSY